MLNEPHLRRIIFPYASYYKQARTALGKDSPIVCPMHGDLSPSSLRLNPVFARDNEVLGSGCAKFAEGDATVFEIELSFHNGDDTILKTCQF
jgi:hypothetical protein